MYDKLARLPAPPGSEGAVCRAMAEELAGTASKVFTDNIGNLYARIGAEHAGPRVVLSAHMDEIGTVVTRIRDDGRLTLGSIGLHYLAHFDGTDLAILTGEAMVPGRAEIVNPPESFAHVEDDLARVVVRTRADSPEAAATLGIQPGDKAVFSAAPRQESGRVVGKAADDRTGCWALITAARALAGRKLAGELWLLGTAQEEGANIYVAWSGARAAMELLWPDFVIGVDTDSIAADWSAEAPNVCPFSLADGLGIIRGAQDLSLPLTDFLLQTAHDAGIRTQLIAKPATVADYTVFQRGPGGAQCAAIVVPIEQAHSAQETFVYDTMSDAATLAVEAVLRLDEMAKLLPANRWRNHGIGTEKR